MEFVEFPKMARLSREVVITEKIDGTNSSITIQNVALETDLSDPNIVVNNGDYTMRVGSRTRWIVPGDDNHGFARWVKENSECLFGLGEGTHFGEWWGSGIQRGYGLSKGEKRFSLFNTTRWTDDVRPKCCSIVPELYRGNFTTDAVERALENLRLGGSMAAPGFKRPEGIVIFHTAGNVGFKKTLEKDEIPKSLIS